MSGESTDPPETTRGDGPKEQKSPWGLSYSMPPQWPTKRLEYVPLSVGIAVSAVVLLFAIKIQPPPEVPNYVINRYFLRIAMLAFAGCVWGLIWVARDEQRRRRSWRNARVNPDDPYRL